MVMAERRQEVEKVAADDLGVADQPSRAVLNEAENRGFVVQSYPASAESELELVNQVANFFHISASHPKGTLNIPEGTCTRKI